MRILMRFCFFRRPSLCDQCKRLVFCFVIGILSLDARSQEKPIFSMSLEELLQIKISITTRTNQPIFDSASAVYVITQTDIKRSGLRTIPEILRLVPGFHIARQDGNKWHINSRRNSLRFSNSMQVLMDGRTLYNSLFGGTYWEIQDTMIDDIERIEIIRGPGASSWGANAITGVINIITKSSQETQGGLLFAGAGQGETKGEIALRYGVNTEKIHRPEFT